MTVLLGAAPSIIGPSEVGAWMAAKGAPGAAAVLDFAGQQYGFRSAAGVPRRGSVASDMIFSRASAAGRWPKSGPYETVASGGLRYEHDPATRAPLGVLIEGPAAPISTDTANFAATGSSWAVGGSGALLVEAVPSIFAGGVAGKHTSPSGGSSQSRYQAKGVLQNRNYRFDVIFERSDSSVATSVFGLLAGTWLGLVSYNWNTGALSYAGGSPSGYIVENLGTGPNGGELVRASAVANTGTATSASFYIYPVGLGSTAGQSCIVHYACCTPGGASSVNYWSPMIVGAAAQSQASDNLSLPLPIELAAGFTLGFRARMPRVSNSGDSNILFSILPASGIGNRIDVDTYSGVGTLWFNRPSGGTFRRIGAGIGLGAELRGAVSWSASRGWRGTVNGEAVVIATDAPPSDTLTKVTIGHRAGAAQWGTTIKRLDFWQHGDFTDDQMRGLLAA